ncbi:MAG: DUF4278 domain-containing protein [Leptolyngbyaceae cyanobacterium bins.59]|nr:DUF4278 domain-containing protein [Leptolyngbyaceae cyanobacterium bins.59]
MKYRGVSYEYEQPALDMIAGEIGGLYRGQNWQVRHPRHMPVHQPPLALKYRGVAYVTHCESLDDRVIEAWTNPNSQGQADPIVKVNQQPQLSGWIEVHRTNLQSNLERRIQIAQERGDRMLVQLLEKELQELAW